MAEERSRMPVVSLARTKLESCFPRMSLERIIENLPFIGLDIEGIDEQTIRVEYNPNRPDYSSDYGIIRSLKGLLGIEIGIPTLNLSGRSGVTIKVDPKVRQLRPIISALVASGGILDSDDVKQLITMQEDLHNGLGRKRKKASIGIHNLDSIQPPIRYTTVTGDYSFTPLGEAHTLTISEVLKQTEAGKAYAELTVGWPGLFPAILDSRGTLLSFPPIINGNITKVEAGTDSLFVEVTGIDAKSVDDILAVMAMNLVDSGFKIRTVNISGVTVRKTAPSFPTRQIVANKAFLCDIVGLELSSKTVEGCLKRCRLGATTKGKEVICTIPRYRLDIQSEIDLAEELAIGYGINRLEPSLPTFFSSGGKSVQSLRMNTVRDIMIGLGMIENLSYSLSQPEIQFSPFGLNSLREQALAVESSKSSEHVILRNSLLPSLLEALSRNIHEEYPQNLFEIGRVFGRDEDGRIIEKWSIAAVFSSPEASYTDARRSVMTLLEIGFGIKDNKTQPSDSSSNYYVSGRAAELTVSGRKIGSIGEIKPEALVQLRLRMPTSAFEVDLSTAVGI